MSDERQMAERWEAPIESGGAVEARAGDTGLELYRWAEAGEEGTRAGYKLDANSIGAELEFALGGELLRVVAERQLWAETCARQAIEPELMNKTRSDLVAERDEAEREADDIGERTNAVFDDLRAGLREMTDAHSEETGARCRAEDDLAAERQTSERWKRLASKLREALNKSLTEGLGARAIVPDIDDILADPDGAQAAAEWAALREQRDSFAAEIVRLGTPRKHSIEEIRDHWLKNRGQDGTNWEDALGAVYDLAGTAAKHEIAALEAQLAEARETLRSAIEREEGIAETWRKEAAAIGNDAPAEMLRHRTSIQTIAGTLEQAAARLREDAGLLSGEEATGE